jgi:hypothetical protein
MKVEDLRHQRLPLALLTLVALISALAMHAVYRDARSAHLRLQQERSQLQAATARLQRDAEERALVDRYRERYVELERRGFMAPEQRTVWAAGLAAANDAAQLFGIEYRIDPQRPYAAAQPLDTAALALAESRMHLKAGLLHEEDLAKLLDALTAQRAGLFLLERCALARAPDGDGRTYRPQLTVDCELAWLTARPRGAEVRR